MRAEMASEMQAEMQASQVQMKQALLRIERQRGSVADDADADAETFAAVQADVEVEMTTRLEQLREATEALANESEPLAKQQGVLRCRDARAALVAASKNVQDIGTALGVVVGFLAEIDGKLEGLANQLDHLQESVAAMHADLKGLRQDVAAIASQVSEAAPLHSPSLPTHQHRSHLLRLPPCDVPPLWQVSLLVGATSDELLERHKKATLATPLPAKPLMPPRTEQGGDLLDQLEAFASPSNPQVCCLLGLPGSGKSIIFKLYQRRLFKARDNVVALFVSLPTLQRAMLDLLPETLERFYEFTDARVGELKRARKGGLRAPKILICADALDEAPIEVQCANLFQSNRLDSWGAPGSGWPRLLISCRTTHFPPTMPSVGCAFSHAIRSRCTSSRSASLRSASTTMRPRSLCGSSAPSSRAPSACHAARPDQRGPRHG